MTDWQAFLVGVLVIDGYWMWAYVLDRRDRLRRAEARRWRERRYGPGRAQ